QSEEGCPHEYLCLNIHLTKENAKPFGQTEAIERFKRGIGLFYAELGLSDTAEYTPRTPLSSALTVTLDNYKAQGFSCKHEASLAVLSKHHEAKKYTRTATNPVDVPEKEKSKRAPGFFSFESSDFPPLSAPEKPKRAPKILSVNH
ncbi:MAG TPA: hypothetical protein DDY37_06310, partial [Legionella sp.]|nr:hypothetical protein [Legionella sp.]